MRRGEQRKGLNMQRSLAILLTGCLLATSALADNVKIENAWVRATAPGQKVAGGFMDLTADADMTLIGGSSPVSREFELHFMRMQDGVMEMRQMQEIKLPKGKTVSLEPGDLHVMFIGLKSQIKPGQKVPMTLIVKDADGKQQKLAVQAEARSSSSH
jgi:copper(I)-binding protein